MYSSPNLPCTFRIVIGIVISSFQVTATNVQEATKIHQNDSVTNTTTMIIHPQSTTLLSSGMEGGKDKNVRRLVLSLNKKPTPSVSSSTSIPLQNQNRDKNHQEAHRPTSMPSSKNYPTNSLKNCFPSDIFPSLQRLLWNIKMSSDRPGVLNWKLPQLELEGTSPLLHDFVPPIDSFKSQVALQKKDDDNDESDISLEDEEEISRRKNSSSLKNVVRIKRKRSVTLKEGFVTAEVHVSGVVRLIYSKHLAIHSALVSFVLSQFQEMIDWMNLLNENGRGEDVRTQQHAEKQKVDPSSSSSLPNHHVKYHLKISKGDGIEHFIAIIQPNRRGGDEKEEGSAKHNIKDGTRKKLIVHSKRKKRSRSPSSASTISSSSNSDIAAIVESTFTTPKKKKGTRKKRVHSTQENKKETLPHLSHLSQKMNTLRGVTIIGQWKNLLRFQVEASYNRVDQHENNRTEHTKEEDRTNLDAKRVIQRCVLKCDITRSHVHRIHNATCYGDVQFYLDNVLSKLYHIV